MRQTFISITNCACTTATGVYPTRVSVVHVHTVSFCATEGLVSSGNSRCPRALGASRNNYAATPLLVIGGVAGIRIGTFQYSRPPKYWRVYVNKATPKLLNPTACKTRHPRSRSLDLNAQTEPHKTCSPPQRTLQTMYSARFPPPMPSKPKN